MSCQWLIVDAIPNYVYPTCTQYQYKGGCLISGSKLLTIVAVDGLRCTVLVHPCFPPPSLSPSIFLYVPLPLISSLSMKRMRPCPRWCFLAAGYNLGRNGNNRTARRRRGQQATCDEFFGLRSERDECVQPCSGILLYCCTDGATCMAQWEQTDREELKPSGRFAAHWSAEPNRPVSAPLCA